MTGKKRYGYTFSSGSSLGFSLTYFCAKHNFLIHYYQLEKEIGQVAYIVLTYINNCYHWNGLLVKIFGSY